MRIEPPPASVPPASDPREAGRADNGEPREPASPLAGEPVPAASPSSDAQGSQAGDAGKVLELGPGGGRYLLVRQLGRGGMAEVWLARRVAAVGDFERDVALKRIRPDHLADDADAEMYRRMFLDEAHLAAALTHPCIAQVFDLQELGDAIYLVMEYVAGSSLRQLIQLSERKGRSLLAGFRLLCDEPARGRSPLRLQRTWP